MTKPCSTLRLLALTACASVMLAACATSPGPSATADPTAADPKGVAQGQAVQHDVQTRLVCPAELGQAAPGKPNPADDALIQHNESGGAFLAALNDWGEQLLALFNDAKADCQAQETPQ